MSDGIDFDALEDGYQKSAPQDGPSIKMVPRSQGAPQGGIDFDSLEGDFQYETLTKQLQDLQAKQNSGLYELGKGLATGAMGTAGAAGGAFLGATSGNPIVAAGGGILGGSAAAAGTEAAFQAAFEDNIDWGRIALEGAFGAVTIPAAGVATKMGGRAMRAAVPTTVKGMAAGIRTFGPTAVKFARQLKKPGVEKMLRGIGTLVGLGAGGVKGGMGAYFTGMLGKGALEGLEAAAKNPASRKALHVALNTAHRRLAAASDNLGVIAAQMLFYNELAQIAQIPVENLFDRDKLEMRELKRRRAVTYQAPRLFP